MSLLELAPPVGGDEVARYRMLASALAGFDVDVALGVEGEQSYTDGRTIYVCPAADPYQRDRITVQAALLAAGSLEPAIMRRLLGRPSLARRYLSIEGDRALALIAALVPGASVSTWLRAKPGDVSRCPEESLAQAFRFNAVPDPPDIYGVLRPRRILSTDRAREGSLGTPRQSAVPATPVSEADEDDETEALGKIAKKMAKLLASPRWIKALQKYLRSQGSGADQAPDPGSEMSSATFQTTSRTEPTGALSLTPPPTKVNTPAPRSSSVFRYPEWDTGARSYRPDWCTVREVEARAKDSGALEYPETHDLRRRLARLGVGLQRCRRQAQGDEVDLDAAVEAQVDTILGFYANDDELYVESQRRKRALSVCLLLDISGSSTDGESSSTSVHARQRAAAGALMHALGSLGDRVCLYGFRSEGRHAVYFVRLKAFADELDERVYERLAGIVPGGYTRLGAAIRHAAHILEKRGGTECRLLVVLSDGLPYDDDYEGGYAEADTRSALAEVRRSGIGCLCLTLGASTEPEALGRVFGTASHANAPSLELLTGEIGRLFRSALVSADLQRRIGRAQMRGSKSERPG